MDITVIIPMFNGAKWIRETIESVFAQYCPPSEIIVVDNNSTDSSVEIISTFPQIKLINNPIPGPNSTRQCGFQASKGDLIAYLDQDDIWHPNHLKYLSCLLEQYPDYPAVVASSISFSSSKHLSFPNPTVEAINYNPWKIFPTNQILTPSSVLIRRTALESIGGWPSHVDFCADVYTWLRLSVNHPFLQNKGVTVGYRKHNNSQTNTLLRTNTQKYFDSLFNALEDVLTYYPVVCEQEYSQFKRRLFSLSAMSDLIFNIMSSDCSQLSKSIMVFEESLSTEKKEFVGSMCGLLIWFLYGNLSYQPFLLSSLLKSWPPSASRTREAFRLRIASSRILPQRLLSEPFNGQLWLLLLQYSNRIVRKLPLYRW